MITETEFGDEEDEDESEEENQDTEINDQNSNSNNSNQQKYYDDSSFKEDGMEEPNEDAQHENVVSTYHPGPGSIQENNLAKLMTTQD